MVDTNNVFGFNYREELHENDVKQSFFHLFYDCIISKDKMRVILYRPRPLPPDSTVDAAPRRWDLFQTLHAFQHRRLDVNSEFLWRTPTAVSAFYLSDHITRSLRN